MHSIIPGSYSVQHLPYSLQGKALGSHCTFLNVAFCFLKAQRLCKVIGLLRTFHRGFDDDDAPSINDLRSARIARNANDYSPAGVHPNSERCVFHAHMDSSTSLKVELF